MKQKDQIESIKDMIKAKFSQNVNFLSEILHFLLLIKGGSRM